MIRLIKNIGPEVLLQLFSPALFKILPVRGTTQVILEIARDYRNPNKFKETIEEIVKALNAHPHSMANPWQFCERKKIHPVEIDSLTHEEKKVLGEKILELYFTQIFRSPTVLLDLSLNSMGTHLQWSPLPIMVEWDVEFIRAIRNLYEGLFNQNPEKIDSALKDLKMFHAKEVMLEHFGQGDLSAVLFKMESLSKSLSEMIHAFKKQSSQVSTDFITLGIFLLGLYQTLDKINVPLNVRRAFLRSVSQSGH